MGRAFEYRRASKEKRWASMSRIFPKISRAITLAAKDGGPDPDMNSKLRLAINLAKANNMPKDNVDSAIKRADGKDGTDYSEISYEGKGPHGVLIYVECATDNNVRTVANVKSYFVKSGGQVVPSGSLDFLFDRKTVIEFDKPAEVNLEELEFELIDSGLQEFEEDGNTIYAYGDYASFGTLVKAFEERKLNVTSAKLERIATSPMEYTDEQMIDIQKLIDKLEDDDDVQNVYTNIA